LTTSIIRINQFIASPHTQDGIMGKIGNAGSFVGDAGEKLQQKWTDRV
jgi:hypothetical protein